jgi:outer membrane lipoprotein-sorting protein
MRLGLNLLLLAVINGLIPGTVAMVSSFAPFPTCHSRPAFVEVAPVEVAAQEASNNTTSNNPPTAQAIIDRVINAIGGTNYLQIKSERARGFVTPYRPFNDKETEPDKLATQSFLDYVMLPDKERVEFKGQKRRFIQVNVSDTGWTYDSDSQILRDQSVEQRQRYQQGLRSQIDYLLKQAVKLPGTKLTYLPSRDLWPRQPAEGVEITYANGFSVSLFLEALTDLPLAIRYVHPEQRTKNETRFYKYIDNNGIKAAYIVDLYEDGKQTLRINYEEREFNAAFNDKLFIKPDNPKAIK